MSREGADIDFELVYGALPVAVGLLAEGRVLRVNAAMALLFGAPAPELEGRSIWDFVTADEARERLRPRYDARLRGESVVTQYEMELFRASGEKVRVACVAQALANGQTVVVFRELAGGRPPLLAALPAAAARVQRARTPEEVLRVATEALRDLGLIPYISQNLGDHLEVVAPTDSQDAMLVLMARVGRSPKFDLARLEALKDRARYIDDFAAAVRSHLKAGGIDPARFAPEIERPERSRAVVAPLVVEGKIWGSLTVAAQFLEPGDVGAMALFAAQVGSSLEIATSLQTLEQRNRHLAAVHAVAAAGAETELSRLVPQLLAIATAGTESECGGVWLIEGNELVLVSSHGEPSYPAGQRIPLGAGLTGSALERGAPQAWRMDPPPSDAFRGAVWAGVSAMAVFPLMHQGRAVGSLNLCRLRPQQYSEAELQGGELIANQVVIQIEKARLIEAERRRVHDLQLMLDVGRLITASLDLDETLEAAASNLARLLDASDAFIWLYEPLTRELRGAATSTPDYREHFRQVRLIADEAPTAAAQAMLRREPVRIVDAEDSPIINPALNREYKMKSLLALPLLQRDQPIGAVSIGDRYRTRRWTEAEVERATVVASQLAVSVANARLFDDLKRSYDKLAQAREELVKRERLAALGELSAVVAHEVRNPLGVVFNSLGALRKAVQGNADAEKLLLIVGEEADRLNRIVSDLLDFARPHEASLRLESLEAILDGAREATLALTGGALGIQLELAALPRIPLDARMMRQALINLLVNAVQASPRGGSVVLRAGVESGFVRICIEDRGQGIPEANRHRIFQPFFTTKATGTGLGLAVVKRIVEAHSGEVTLATGDGQGTIFTVRLPVHPGAEAALPVN